jgi:hypothetical protein
VLIRRMTLMLSLSLLAQPAGAEGLRKPRKLTVALSDELLGQLAPDGRHLYFLSNRNATAQVFTQDLAAPSSTLLFDEGADVSWPRVSPDGKRLLYVSYRDDAAGRLCVRELDSSHRACLEDQSGALEASWVSADQLLVLARPSPDADLRLERVTVAHDRLRSRPFLTRNLTGPAVSPDGRWLVFVPVDRDTGRAGGRLGPAFAGQAARRLMVRRLDGGAETAVRFDLPGASGQPAFSRDGRWLYFTQYLNDTDQNGRLDADDHGVVFRVAFGGGDDAPAQLAQAVPEQLTSAAWNCQYPAPAGAELILTCARHGSLDLYALPLDGVVPETLDAARLREEADASRDLWERLLLLHRLARREADPRARASLTLEAIRLHLELGEYESASFYAHALAHGDGGELGALGPPLLPLIAERRALRAFDRGQLGQRFLADMKRRLDELRALAGSGDARTLARLAESEILDDLGDKPAALRALESATVDEHAATFVVTMRAGRAEALYRELDRSDELRAALRPLSAHPSLAEAERLRIAGVYARSVVRGLPAGEAARALDRELATAPSGSALAFRLELARCLDKVAPSTLAAGRACMNELYARSPALERRRVLVAEVLRRAEDTDADDLEYELVREWVADLPRDAAERRWAEHLFRQVVEDYAYGALAAGRPAEAAGEFAAVTEHTESLESHVGFIEASFAAGRADAVEGWERRHHASPALLHFVRAYLTARGLPDLDGPAFDRGFTAALGELQTAERGLVQKAEVQALHGALLHLRYLRSGDRNAAEEANTHYLLALDLAYEHPRYRAMVLEQLALLHAAVGNHRIAIGHFEERALLPFPDARVALGHRLLQARSLLHVGRDAEAARSAAVGLSLVEKQPAIGRFRPLALDRAALYALASGDSARAATLYDEAGRADRSFAGPSARLASVPPLSVGAHDRNRVVFTLAHATAALGVGKAREALADLDQVDRALADPVVQRALAWPQVSAEDVRTTYELLRLGLRAQAERSLGRLDDSWKALDARRALLADRLKRRNLDDDLLSLSLAEAQLADLAQAKKLGPEAARYISQSLSHADLYARRTETPLADAQLSALGFAAGLLVHGLAPASAFGFDVPARLRDAFDHLGSTREAARRETLRRFGMYLTLLSLDGVK